MKYKMNICDFCCGLFSKCEDVCPYSEYPLTSDMDKYFEAERRFGDFLEAHAEWFKEEMRKGKLKPNDNVEIEYQIKKTYTHM